MAPIWDLNLILATYRSYTEVGNSQLSLGFSRYVNVARDSCLSSFSAVDLHQYLVWEADRLVQPVRPRRLGKSASYHPHSCIVFHICSLSDESIRNVGRANIHHIAALNNASLATANMGRTEA